MKIVCSGQTFTEEMDEDLHFLSSCWSQKHSKCFILLNSLYSGGPVIKRNWDNGAEVFTLVGVVSGNPVGCSILSAAYPDFYTFVGEQKVQTVVSF